ncbi:MAG TPA: hypothetical protein VK694_01485 [Verrucomicrobiae bacterium]|nr:hypothetical protein [Verrucomicrobiae bacterium]
MTHEENETEEAAEEETKPSDALASTATWYFVGGLAAAMLAANSTMALVSVLGANDVPLVPMVVVTLILLVPWTLCTYAAVRLFVSGVLRVGDALHARSMELDHVVKQKQLEDQPVPRR